MLVGTTEVIGLPNRTYPGRVRQDLSSTCCTRRKGRFDRGGEGGTTSLLSVKFLSMADDDFFRLPDAKVEEMEKTFRDNGICHFVAWRVT